jgi:hypothetical protein
MLRRFIALTCLLAAPFAASAQLDDLDALLAGLGDESFDAIEETSAPQSPIPEPEPAAPAEDPLADSADAAAPVAAWDEELAAPVDPPQEVWTEQAVEEVVSEQAVEEAEEWEMADFDTPAPAAEPPADEWEMDDMADFDVPAPAAIPEDDPFADLLDEEPSAEVPDSFDMPENIDEDPMMAFEDEAPAEEPVIDEDPIATALGEDWVDDEFGMAFEEVAVAETEEAPVEEIEEEEVVQEVAESVAQEEVAEAEPQAETPAKAADSRLRPKVADKSPPWSEPVYW